MAIQRPSLAAAMSYAKSFVNSQLAKLPKLPKGQQTFDKALNTWNRLTADKSPKAAIPSAPLEAELPIDKYLFSKAPPIEAIQAPVSNALDKQSVILSGLQFVNKRVNTDLKDLTGLLEILHLEEVDLPTKDGLFSASAYSDKGLKAFQPEVSSLRKQIEQFNSSLVNGKRPSIAQLKLALSKLSNTKATYLGVFNVLHAAIEQAKQGHIGNQDIERIRETYCSVPAVYEPTQFGEEQYAIEQLLFDRNQQPRKAELERNLVDLLLNSFRENYRETKMLADVVKRAMAECYQLAHETVPNGSPHPANMTMENSFARIIRDLEYSVKRPPEYVQAGNTVAGELLSPILKKQQPNKNKISRHAETNKIRSPLTFRTQMLLLTSFAVGGTAAANGLARIPSLIWPKEHIPVPTLEEMDKNRQKYFGPSYYANDEYFPPFYPRTKTTVGQDGKTRLEADVILSQQCGFTTLFNASCNTEIGDLSYKVGVEMSTQYNHGSIEKVPIGTSEIKEINFNPKKGVGICEADVLRTPEDDLKFDGNGNLKPASSTKQLGKFTHGGKLSIKIPIGEGHMKVVCTTDELAEKQEALAENNPKKP